MWSRLSAVGVANDDLGEQAGDCAAERCAWVPESEHGCGSWKNTQESTRRSSMNDWFKGTLTLKDLAINRVGAQLAQRRADRLAHTIR